jgi:hypothetical protein
MNKAYIVIIYNSCYSDFWKRQLFVTLNKKEAELYVIRFNILLKKWKDYFEKMKDENGFIIEDKEHFMDRIMTFDEIVEASYREIELR